MQLSDLGWGPDLADTFEPHAAAGLTAGRIAVQHRGASIVLTELGELSADLAGRLLHESQSGELPVTGDWVAVAARPEEGTATIQAVLPRRTSISRKAAGPGSEEQVIAANIDTLFLVSALTSGLNPRRIERYLATAWESGAQPVVVLTKADLCDDLPAALAEVEAVAFGVPVLPISSVTGEGYEALDAYLAPGRTIAVVGSSGVGQSTLVNRLAGYERLATQDTRNDGKGRHTTSHRELVLLPGGGLVLDTPGMRELHLWDAGEGVGEAFGDVEELAATCRFSDCSHGVEPGCAVRGALEAGTLTAERWENYVSLQRELAFLARRQDSRLAAEERRKWKAISKANKTTAW
ncbi:MAG: ribosome small subunit-dependent GTPase A [Gaiellaceae bacterium]